MLHTQSLKTKKWSVVLLWIFFWCVVDSLRSCLETSFLCGSLGFRKSPRAGSRPLAGLLPDLGASSAVPNSRNPLTGRQFHVVSYVTDG